MLSIIQFLQDKEEIWKLKAGSLNLLEVHTYFVAQMKHLLFLDPSRDKTALEGVKKMGKGAELGLHVCGFSVSKGTRAVRLTC